MHSCLPTYLRRFALLALPCLALNMNADSAFDKVLFDFTTAATNSPAWQIVNDEVMGGLSTSQFQILTNAAVFRGNLSLANQGGFASVRSPSGRTDLGGLDQFVLRVRGDGHRYKFNVRTETGFDAPLYQCAFSTKPGKWEEHRFPFRAFVPTYRGRVLPDAPPLDPAGVVSIGLLISDKQAGPFKLEVAWIKATPRADK